MEEIKVLLGSAEGEITEKKSRFIGQAFEIHSEQEALDIIESVRKKYYDARHNCYAYVLGERHEIQRFSDDKEPQGTAGKPILEVLTGQGYHNTLMVVTRYFGGILLGTGGLIRAYTAASQEALRQAEESGHASAVSKGQQMAVTCDYNLSGKLQYLVNQQEIPLSGIRYAEKVTFDLVVPVDCINSFINKITEASNGASVINQGDSVTYIMKDSVPAIYSW